MDLEGGGGLKVKGKMYMNEKCVCAFNKKLYHVVLKNVLQKGGSIHPSIIKEIQCKWDPIQKRFDTHTWTEEDLDQFVMYRRATVAVHNVLLKDPPKRTTGEPVQRLAKLIRQGIMEVSLEMPTLNQDIPYLFVTYDDHKNRDGWCNVWIHRDMFTHITGVKLAIEHYLHEFKMELFKLQNSLLK